MKISKAAGALVLTSFITVSDAGADDGYRQQAGIDSAVSRYGVKGKGVVIAILDRGIEWQNPDFINTNGTTRIKWLLDMSGQNWCNTPKVEPREYTEREINLALRGRGTLETRDAVGHGTLTAGIAAGNGRLHAYRKYRGVAPKADLIIVKMTSDGAPEHHDQPAEARFNGCIPDALDWLDKKLNKIRKPVVGLINSGVQLWGPTDGSSNVSQKIDEVFGKRRGRIFVIPSGDEGCLPTHAGGMYSNQDTIVKLSRITTAPSKEKTQLAMWFRGPPVSVNVEFDGGDRSMQASTDAPGKYDSKNGISIWVREPGQELDPRISNSGDHFVEVTLKDHFVDGHIILRGHSPTEGRFDIYSDSTGRGKPSRKCPDYSAVTRFLDHLALGRLTDYASTMSAIVIGAYVSTDTWLDIDGKPRKKNDIDVTGRLWSGSSGGPTRDGRRGVDLAAPGESIFGTYATNSTWALRSTSAKNSKLEIDRSFFVQGGGWRYAWQGATSGAAPIAVGAIALMLQMKPDLTSDQARDLLTATAISDKDTDLTPNYGWGYGKINVRGALDRLCKLYRQPKCLRR